MATSPSCSSASATQRTLLVEGASDKIIISALLIRVPLNPTKPRILIDTAETIKNSGIGNRERVELVHAAALALGVTNYACLVDREFRLFQCNPPYRDTLATHHVQDNVLFWTRGHSIENYLFAIESLIRYLEIAYADVLPVNYKKHVDDSFLPLMKQAAAFSLTASEATVITRADSIIKLQDWSLAPSGLPHLDVSRIGIELARRAATPTQVTQFLAAYPKHLTDIAATDVAFHRWVSHGHLGSQVLWSGIAFLLSQHGFDADSTEQLRLGKHDQKCRITADLWAERCASNAPDETPTQLLLWLA